MRNIQSKVVLVKTSEGRYGSGGQICNGWVRHTRGVYDSDTIFWWIWGFITQHQGTSTPRKNTWLHAERLFLHLRRPLEPHLCSSGTSIRKLLWVTLGNLNTLTRTANSALSMTGFTSWPLFFGYPTDFSSSVSSWVWMVTWVSIAISYDLGDTGMVSAVANCTGTFL